MKGFAPQRICRLEACNITKFEVVIQLYLVVPNKVVSVKGSSNFQNREREVKIRSYCGTFLKFHFLCAYISFLSFYIHTVSKNAFYFDLSQYIHFNNLPFPNLLSIQIVRGGGGVIFEYKNCKMSVAFLYVCVFLFHFTP